MRSCETRLLNTVNDLVRSLNDRGQIDTILLDFSKTFDEVCSSEIAPKIEVLRNHK